MKKIALILVVLSIFIIILYFVMYGFDIDQNTKEQYQPPICGNNICEESEESYCLDCNLSCKSELCNSKINIICDGCTETQRELLPTLFEHQTIVYDCLSNYYGYHPPRLIYHTIVGTGIAVEPCTKKEGCYITGGIIENLGVKQGFIPGLRKYGENDVTEQENVGFGIHELAHVFTHYAFGNWVPAWFNEGISIYTESRVLCHTDHILSEKIDSFLSLYNKLKKGNITLDEAAPYDEYYKVKHNAHRIGAIYFGALEQDYNCNKNCIAKILYSLYQYRENCTGTCFENARSLIPQLANVSLDNKDLRIPIITNEIIKQKSEEIVGQDLTDLFKLLEIN